MIRLSEVERAYFVRKLGELAITVPANEPLNNLKRRYFAEFVGGFSPSTKIDEIEKLFLIKILGDAVVTPQSNRLSDLWQQAAGIALQSPSKYINQNKINFYLNAL